MTADSADRPPDHVLRLDHDPLRRTSARLERLARDLDAVAEPREPDVGQRRLVEGRLALPVVQPASDLSSLLSALAAALVAASRGASVADADAAALSRLLLRELP